MNRTLAFIKNNVIATSAMIAAGVVASDIANYLTENYEAISISSTAAQFLTGGPSFLYLHFRTNRENYTHEGKFNLKEFIWDYVKYSGVSAIVCGAAYFLGRPFLQRYFLGKEMEPGESSIKTDAIALLGYVALQIPIAKLTGIIKNGAKNNAENRKVNNMGLEDKVWYDKEI